MNIRKLITKTRNYFTVVATTSMIEVGHALAQQGDWTKPATDLAETLESGLVRIGAVVAGIGVIVVGLIACAAGKMEWSRLGYVVVGALLIMAGPEAIRTLIA